MRPAAAVAGRYAAAAPHLHCQRLGLGVTTHLCLPRQDRDLSDHRRHWRGKRVRAHRVRVGRVGCNICAARSTPAAEGARPGGGCHERAVVALEPEQRSRRRRARTRRRLALRGRHGAVAARCGLADDIRTTKLAHTHQALLATTAAQRIGAEREATTPATKESPIRAPHMQRQAPHPPTATSRRELADCRGQVSALQLLVAGRKQPAAES